MAYTSYAYSKMITQFPKIAYQNPFEPAYTRPQVKYNAHIIIPMVIFTLWFSNWSVECEKKKNADLKWYIHSD